MRFRIALAGLLLTAVLIGGAAYTLSSAQPAKHSAPASAGLAVVPVVADAVKSGDVPIYLRGKTGAVEAVIEPAAIDYEKEGYGRNAGSKRHYYRIALPMTEIWPDYAGSPRDGLRVEVFETWLERI